MPHPEARHQTDNAADEEKPAEQDRHRQGCDWRQDDGCRAKHQQHDTFDEEEHPVLMKRGHSRALNTLNAGLLGGHESLHGFLP